MEISINESYKIDYSHEKIGLAVVFLSEMKSDSPETKKALLEDYEDFKKLFADMRFDVKSYSGEMKFSTVVENLEAVLEEIQRNPLISCFICMFIGHGGPGFINTADGKLDIHENILSKFMPQDCLKGKPKIFIFQTCRGTRHNFDSLACSGTLTVPTVLNPEGSDMLLCYASWQGFVSYCVNTKGKGTCYLQELHSMLRKFADGTNHLIDILTVLNRQVSSSPIMNSQRTDYFYQMPSFESSLRKKLFLLVDQRMPETAPTGDRGDSGDFQSSQLNVNV
uniref:Caspase-6-like n=2 Tax=Ciona intestinalis TaxID=7719 RepID=F6TBD6_CIOIN|nr:caspase-6-like isoform X1 [Ciona intestinalis]|eukprot:XP_002123720.1 caspase-6-like isoform X1 [Ciona intestinalis]